MIPVKRVLLGWQINQARRIRAATPFLVLTLVALGSSSADESRRAIDENANALWDQIIDTYTAAIDGMFA